MHFDMKLPVPMKSNIENVFKSDMSEFSSVEFKYCSVVTFIDVYLLCFFTRY